MNLGMEIGPVRRTRSVTGEVNAGIAGEVRKSATAEKAPVTVNVEATLAADGTYTLAVEVARQQASLEKVEADDLGETIARLIRRLLSKAVQDGELAKNRPRDSNPLGMGAPRSSRDNLRFGR